MKRYMLKRILFSLFSLLVVVATVMILCFTAIKRENIFNDDPAYIKYTENEKKMYEYNKYQKYGYLTYENYTTFLQKKYNEQYGPGYEEREDYQTSLAAIQDPDTYTQNVDVQDFTSKYSRNGYNVTYLKPIMKGSRRVQNGYLISVREKNVFERLGSFFGNMFYFETVNDVTDSNLTNRGIHIEWDQRSNMPALVGSGTTHKYLIYFDNQFPFIHINLFHFNLGQSYVVYRDENIVDIMTKPTGSPVTSEQEYPSQIGTGITHPTSTDFHSVTYSSGTPSELDKEIYGDDPYRNATTYKDGMSRIGLSFTIGIIATFFAYLLGLPLGIWMARRKDKLVDKLGNFYIIFIMAVPSLAYIFMFCSIGTALFKLPYKYALATIPVLGCILPCISLALPQMGGLMKWMRRYMIDQKNADYVKFARAQGLSEGEIFSKHISKNAFVFLVHGIPAEILGALTGAIITERVYGVPGVGNILTSAITKYDNSLIVACTFFYTLLSIVALILGDLLLAKYDPRITFSEGGN